MLKPNSSVAPGTAKLAADDEMAWKGLPNLRDFFLSQTYRGVDLERSPGLLIMRASKDGWQLTLKETTACAMLRVTGRTLDEAWLLADALLGDPAAPWETDPYEAGKRGRSRGRKPS